MIFRAFREVTSRRMYFLCKRKHSVLELFHFKKWLHIKFIQTERLESQATIENGFLKKDQKTVNYISQIILWRHFRYDIGISKKKRKWDIFVVHNENKPFKIEKIFVHISNFKNAKKDYHREENDVTAHSFCS